MNGEPMRILIVTHVLAKNDGQGRVNYEIARAALAAGHSVTMLAANVAPELMRYSGARFVQMSGGRLPSRLLQYQVFALRTGAWIRAHWHEFDVVHVNGFITWARSDVNSVHFVHDGWYRCGFYPYRLFADFYNAYQVVYTRLNAWLEVRAFRQAQIVVPVSEKVRGEVLALGIDAGRVDVIHNGVDVEEFAPGPSQRARFRLPEAPFMLLFAGDLRVSRKNLDTVLHALVMTSPDVHLVVAGRVQGSPFPALAEQLGLTQRVHFTDFVADMPALMRSVDAFVFPSRYEAMSLALLEALAAALPVVTAKTAGGAEVIGSECGIVLDDPEDACGLAGAIDSLAADRARARQMGEAARALAKTLGWDTMGQRYLSLYEKVCARRAFARIPVSDSAVSIDL